jgi:hypothetical protein
VGSPLRDAGDDANCPALEQRIADRPQDGDGDGVAHCDIGAGSRSRPRSRCSQCRRGCAAGS